MHRTLFVLASIWLVGTAFLKVYAVTRYVFSKQGSDDDKFTTLASRVLLAVFWPIALVTDGGRASLVDLYFKREKEVKR